jgi:hypothetical protein
VDAAVAMAAVAVAFAEALRQRNAPLLERLRAVSRELYGTADARALDGVYRAVVDLPHAAVRRHVGSVPRWLDGDVRPRATPGSPAGRELPQRLHLSRVQRRPHRRPRLLYIGHRDVRGVE